MKRSRFRRVPSHLFLCALLLSAGLVAGCAMMARPGGTEPVAIDSRDYVFLDDLLARRPLPVRQVAGTLALPRESGAGPFPAAILVHTSSGEGSLEWSIADDLLKSGVAVLVLDSFTPRGVERTSDDQAAVSEAAMLADAYGALAHLARDARIDADRVALVGFSKGGSVALYAAIDAVARALAPDGPRFRAHVAFYPWCGLDFSRPLLTGAPVAIHIGDDDDMTSPDLCARLSRRLRGVNPGAEISFFRYAGAGHAFNHPVLRHFPSIPMLVQNPGDCLIAEEPGTPGRFRETSTGRQVTAQTYRTILEECLSHGGSAGHDPAAARLSLARMLALFSRTIGSAPPPSR